MASSKGNPELLELSNHPDFLLSPQDGFRYQPDSAAAAAAAASSAPNATPPPYSGPSTSSAPAPTSSSGTISYLPKLNYALYIPSTFKLSADETAISSSAPVLNSSPTALKELIRQQATIPPKPVVRAVGTSIDGTIDFDIKLNLMTLLYGSDEEERWNYLKTIEDGEIGWRGGTKESIEPVGGGVDRWIDLFCRDDGIKQFTIKRTVSNLDMEYIEGRLHSLISSTLYRGRVVITFPTTFSEIVIKSSYKGRDFLTNVTNLFSATKKYETVKIVWPFASVKPGGDGRLFAVCSEEVWWAEWRDAIRNAVLSKRVGWVSVEDRLEALMCRGQGQAVGKKEWGSSNLGDWGSYY